jgi:hypothetical protein
LAKARPERDSSVCQNGKLRQWGVGVTEKRLTNPQRTNIRTASTAELSDCAVWIGADWTGIGKCTPELSSILSMRVDPRMRFGDLIKFFEAVHHAIKHDFIYKFHDFSLSATKVQSAVARLASPVRLINRQRLPLRDDPLYD